MTYTLFATGTQNENITIQSDIDTLKFLISAHPHCVRFLASKIADDSNYVLSRAPSVTADLHEIQLTIDTDDQDAAERAVRIWAQRSRVAGVRGYRLAMVGEFVESLDGLFTVSVYLSTTVCYNQRRATVNFGNSVEDVESDLGQLYPYIDGVVTATSSLHPGVVFSNISSSAHDGSCDASHDCEVEYISQLMRSIRQLSAGLDTDLDLDQTKAMVTALKAQTLELESALSDE